MYISVPFRDSVLTKLLKNALGGNSKTIMVSIKFTTLFNYLGSISPSVLTRNRKFHFLLSDLQFSFCENKLSQDYEFNVKDFTLK